MADGDKIVDDSFCKSKFISVKHVFHWKIEGFSMLPCDKVLESSVFATKDVVSHRWQLNLFPNGEDAKSSGCVSCHVEMVEGDSVKAFYELLFMESTNTIICQNKSKGSREFNSEEFWGYAKFVTRQTLLDHIAKDDTLIVQCNLKIFQNHVTTTLGKRKWNDEDTDVSKVPRSLTTFGKMFENQLFVDCTVECDGNTIGVHKGVLVAHSPVFEAMFSHNTKESETSNVVITDIEFPVLKEMLRFIYSTQTPDNLQEMVAKLFIAANKYQIADLKSICENYLANHLNAENIRAVLSLAEFHDAPKLKQLAIDFAKGNLDQIADSLLEHSAKDMSAIDVLMK